MAIWRDKVTMGSIGGGKIEFTVIEKAISCLDKREDYHFEYQLNESGLGMVCGGIVKGYIKVFYPKTKLVIIGAGHIGEKLNQLAKVLDFHTVIIDDRDEYANRERFKDADEIFTTDVERVLRDYHLTENDYIVIVTRSHASDITALRLIIDKEVAYIGMIGSTKKIKHVMKELINEGVSIERLKQIYAPIGLDLSLNLPEEIALGIMSEIVMIKNNGSLNHRKDLKKVWD